MIASITHAKPHRRTRDPFVSRLIQEGEVGTVVLVDERTGEVVARRQIK